MIGYKLSYCDANLCGIASFVEVCLYGVTLEEHVAHLEPML